jgi:1,4-alpha-glucan branching enzyme
MDINEGKQEYVRLVLNDIRKLQCEWNIHPWRKEFGKVYHAKATDKLVIRLLGWKGSLQSDRNHAYFLDIMAEKNEGSMVLPDTFVFTVIRAEIGVGLDKDFFPFLHSDEMALEWRREQLMAPSEKWTPLKFIDKQKWQSLSATYTYYGNSRNPHSSQCTLHDLDSFTFQESVTSEVFYSVNQSHNHFIHEEKKHTFTIVMLTWEFPPAVIGGLGRHVWELSRRLAHAGHQVLVVTPHTLGAPPKETVEGIKVYRAKEVASDYDDFHLFVAQTNMNMAEQVRILSSRYKLDLIHAHDWLVGFAARSLKEMMSLPVISTIHALENGRSSLEHPIQQHTNTLEELLISDSDVLIVCSAFMQQELEKRNLDINAIHIISNGAQLSSEKSKSILDFIGRRSFSHLVLFMGRIVPEKGITTLIDAARTTLKGDPECLFVIAGKGPWLTDYKLEISRLGLEKNILLVGFLNEVEKATMLDLADLLVVPSLYEPFGIVALEGMAAGKPVIAARTGGMASIIDHKRTGLLFSPGNSTELSKKITWLLKNPGWRIKLGRNAMDEVKRKYNWEDVREKTEAVYETTITTSSVQ